MGVAWNFNQENICTKSTIRDFMNWWYCQTYERRKRQFWHLLKSIPNKNKHSPVPDVGIELGAACMPSEHASDRATTPGIWWMSVIFSDNETVWPKLWPQNNSSAWPIFHGLVILLNIFKIFWWMNIIVVIMDQCDTEIDLIKYM